MKSKLVLWGTTEQNDRVMIAMQLRAEDNKVDTWLFPEGIVTPDFSQKMLTDWRNGTNTADIAFPEGFKHSERELSLTESLLPEGIKVEREDFVTRAQTEWQFIVLSTKLNQAYKSELAELEDKVAQLSDYSGDAFNALKNFWGKVSSQLKERNLFREHADELRDSTNVLFEKLKGMRDAGMQEFDENSKIWFDKVTALLDEIQQRIEEGTHRFSNVFEKLKATQKQFREQKLSRDHANELWTRIDVLFKTLKEKRFGDEAINDDTPTDRMAKRLEGLISAVDKMQMSIDRDNEELNFQKKRVATSEGQLEAQIRQAKIKMILERVKSKEEKLADMLATKQDVESKMLSFRAKEDRRVADDAKRVAAAARKTAEAEKSTTAEPQKASESVVEAIAATEKGMETAPVADVAVEKISENAPVIETVTAETAPAAEISTPSVTASPKTIAEVKTVVKAETDNGMSDIAADAHAVLEAVDTLG